MARKKISELTAATTPDLDAVIPIVQSGQTLKYKPALPLNVRAFGATGDGSTDDAAAIQSAVDAANTRFSTTGSPVTVRLAGRFAIKPSATSSWNMPLSGSTAEVHIGVNLKSGVILDCTDAEFVALPPTGAQASWHYALFGSAALNMTIGDLEQIKLLRPRFDFTEAKWTTAHTNIYGVIITGVDDLELERPELLSSGSTQQGRLIKVLNSARVRVHEVNAKNITQVLFAAYVNGLEFSGHVDTFVEAFDIDGVCNEVRADVVCINGTGEAQCLDISAVHDGEFKLKCRNVGNAAIVYQKGDNHPTFSDWVTNFPTDTYAAAPVFCERVSLDVEGSDIHHDDLRSIQVNLDRTDSAFGAAYWDGKGHIKDISIRARLSDCDPILVYECDGLDLEATLRTVTTGSSARVNNAAVILRSARSGATPLSESKLSGRARVRVTSSTRTGVRVSAPTDLDLECVVDGYNSADDATSGVASGVWCEDLAAKGGTLTIRNMRISNGDTTVDPTDLRLSWDGAAGPIRVRNLGGHRLETSGATQRCRVASRGYFLDGWERLLKDEVNSLGGTIDLELFTVDAPGARVASAEIVNQSAITGDASNYTVLSIRRIRAGAVSGAIGTTVNYDDTSIAAGTVTDLGLAGDDADGVLVAGDIVALRVAPNNYGSALENLTVRLHVLEFGQ